MAQKKKLQVFVSSTYMDLKEERQAAVEAILTSGHIPAGMELFAAGDESQMNVIKRWIDESDVYMLILGARYGSMDPKSGKSYIQLEYEYALDQGKPLFAVVIEDKYLEKKVKKYGSSVIEKDHPDKLKQFRELVCSKMVRFWSDTKDIKLSIMETMADFSNRGELFGWIPRNEAMNTGAVADGLANQIKESNEYGGRVLSAQLNYANGMLNMATQELFGEYKSTFLSKLEIPTYPGEYEVFKDICAYVTAKVRDALKEYLQSLHIVVNDDISVSVKLILHPKNILDLYPEHFAGSREKLEREKALNEEQLWVITAYRDPDTFYRYSRTGRREVLTTLYSIERNTAFQHIFSGQNDRFQADNLTDLYRHGLYQNENPHWQDQYNSTLVVPLVLEHSPNEKRRYLGFLAVDSLNLEGYQLYEREECYWILNHAALVLSNYFIAQILYHDVQSSNVSP